MFSDYNFTSPLKFFLFLRPKWQNLDHPSNMEPCTIQGNHVNNFDFENQKFIWSGPFFLFFPSNVSTVLVMLSCCLVREHDALHVVLLKCHSCRTKQRDNDKSYRSLIDMFCSQLSIFFSPTLFLERNSIRFNVLENELDYLQNYSR